MKLSTAQFDEIEFSEEKIIIFPEGLIGFDKYKKFVIINMEKLNPFLWLQSVDDSNLSFVMIDPWRFISNFSPEITEEDIKLLNIIDPSSVVIYTLISFEKEFENIKINLMAPICINHPEKLGKQIILNDPKYEFLCELRKSSIQNTKSCGETIKEAINIK